MFTGMRTDIRIEYARQVLGGAAALMAVIAAALLYFRFRGPVGGVSPYETVNDLYEWEYMTFTAEQAHYPTEVETIRLHFRNDAPDGVVCLSSSAFFAYELEFLKDGVWHSMRAKVERPRWSDNDTGGPPGTDIVKWNGGELALHCEIARDYPTPLRPGRYRVVIPDCAHISRTGSALAAEFEVA